MKSVFLLWVLASSGGAIEQPPLSPPTNPSYNLGSAVAMSGERAVIGHSYHERAHVFRRDGTTWAYEALLTGAGGFDQLFGDAVDIDGDTIVVGAHWEQVGSTWPAGAVWVFERSGTTWTQTARLTDPTPASNEDFGRSVSISGDTLAVGVPREGGNGAARLYTRTGSAWTEQQSLTYPGLDELGHSIALDGDTVLVGCDDFSPGGAVVFTRSGTSWSTQQFLQRGNSFGYSVDLVGHRAVIGSPGSNTQGEVHVFARSGGVWSEQDHLTLPVPPPYGTAAEFGYSVSLDGERLLIGSPEQDYEYGLEPGAAYLFRQNGTEWEFASELVGSGASNGAKVGIAVATLGEQSLVCAPKTSTTFSFRDPTVPVAYCTSGLSASGCRATIGAEGTASATQTSGFTLLVGGAEGAVNGLFFWGSNGRQAAPWGNGSSYRCVVPPVKRGQLQSGAGTPGLCDGLFAEDLNARWCPTCPKPGQNPGAGATVQAQLWYRDSQNTSNQTTSLSNAIEFTVAP